MDTVDICALLDFLRTAERLKDTMRTAYTSSGRRESVAEHTWRLCIMALVMEPYFAGVDLARLMKICLVHDLGEAIGGDIPAPAQDDTHNKAAEERRDLLEVLAPLPAAQRDGIAELWDEYERGETPEARLAKALDKLETILQHTQGNNPEPFDYRFNLDYGRRYTSSDPVIAAMRQILDRETERLARAADCRLE